MAAMLWTRENSAKPAQSVCQKPWLFMRRQDSSSESVTVDETESEIGRIDDFEHSEESVCVVASSPSEGRKGCLRVISSVASLSRVYGSGTVNLHQSVQWATVGVYLHKRELGDNQAVSHGHPVTVLS
jgi:hypothetical protein